MTALMMQIDRAAHLPQVAEALLSAGDRDRFKQLLVPCAHELPAAYRMSAMLARAYPEQREFLARVISRFAA